MFKIENILYAMITLRIISSLIELSAAYLMYHFKSVQTAIRINAFLGMVGPIILILVTFIGLVDISTQINIKNIVLIALGVILILIGTR
ncbi:YqhV family protein [Natronospora cellulosivora (SeqCode)]